MAFLTLNAASFALNRPNFSKSQVVKGSICIAGIAGLAWFISGLQGNSLSDLMFFGKEIAKNPAQMGAGFPCSKYLARASIANLPERVNDKPRKFLEVGAGTGIVTAEFIKELFPGDSLDVIELQQPLCDVLTKKFGETPGVTVHCTPIEKFNPGQKYDAVVMTIPFNSLPFELVKTIWTHVIKNLLADGGTISYIFYPMIPTLTKIALTGNKKKDFTERIEKIKNFLDQLNGKYGKSETYELRNIPLVCIRSFEVQKPELAVLSQQQQPIAS